ncbi:MAG: sigma-70 family RNA polymerase sigma factor [Oscillospiraceae bacterium]|nr:sigma-70 family RNA polymerase sigma factor [Oscillospiraceae bacterium]
MNVDFKKDIKLAVSGDCDAFSRLYSIVYKDLYHIALCSLRNPHDAADAVEDAVSDAFAQIRKLRNEDAFRSWIIRILSVKIKLRQSEYINKKSYDEYFADEKGCEFDFKRAELINELNALGDEERLILSLSVLGGYSSQEISKMCSIKPASVRSRLSRTKEKLRIALQDSYPQAL